MVKDSIAASMERIKNENENMRTWEENMVRRSGYHVDGKNIYRDAVVDSTIGKTYYESGENVRKLWERDYSEPIIVNSESELSASVAKAKTFFPADAITTYKDNKGNFVLRIAEPVTSSSIDKEVGAMLRYPLKLRFENKLIKNKKLTNL